MLQASIHKHVFLFAFDARTSRGPMRDKTSWFIKLWDDQQPKLYGLGECGPLPFLSKEHGPDLEQVLTEKIAHFNEMKLSLPAEISDLNVLKLFLKAHRLDTISSLTFALETALLDLANGGSRSIFKNKFSQQQPIPINGLVWMGGLDFMLQQVEIKIRDGYKCVKLKVGGLDFEKECDVLQYIRRKYFRDNIEIRLDANGAFKKEEALQKIHSLKRFQVHSIEQPIKPGLPEMEELCRESPIPIAFDEELIGITCAEDKSALLKKLKPHHIILKPTLHGGLSGCAEWIALAQELNIGWWITSALESNVGLNSIAQFTSQYETQIPHGLGTGQIYTNNFPSPLLAEKGFLLYQPNEKWDLTSLFPDEAVESLYLKD
ncbi:MAG: o-succinylbenzoate synthase [Bacteroidetes bacterium]|nr:o-succinylbenzoate synthase [Bacteroidota bacterium]